MIGYRSGQTLFHRLDPRSKLLFQIAFAVVAFAYTTPRGLVALTLVAAVVALAASISVRQTLWSVRFLFPFLLGAPLIASLSVFPLEFTPADAVEPALSSYRIVLIFIVSAAYVRTTPIRDSRAAIQRTIPGKPGALLGVGVSLVFRYLPILRTELLSIRDAEAARLGSERPLRSRIELFTTAAVRRSFAHADRLSLALSTRCFAWNPTLPRLVFTKLDIPILLLSIVFLSLPVVLR
ncbi:energy-coupling factor transporter transmembrane component T family protein [Natronocalculus amylovorans]|uniref:Energy-coupling factor transporter transmembrane protein EcfT n=1 Tax=Natronocalculus amylovorans TaxID=2917812 RepID=A0AAE3K9A9_9EURY|nr:energy-coupling factor transporter transmembrane component T [Natronocalculus amylovorans]MCL9815849.1 energy-coupling factor transporter transmembrane protein EcfT [Natronocalculus amylovorans]